MLKEILLVIFVCTLINPASAEDAEIVVIPDKSICKEGEKIKIYLQIKNLQINESLTVMGGFKSKNGMVYPLSCEYNLDLYEKKEGLFLIGFSRTGFLSQKIAINDFDEKLESIKLASFESVCYIVEVEPFPKGETGKYSIVKFKIPSNKKIYSLTVNLERE